MRFSIATAWLDPSELPAIARAADEHGYHALSISDHVVNLETLTTPYPYTDDGERRWKPFDPWVDPMVAIGALGAVTERLRFFTNVYVLPMRDPFTVAKTVSTASIFTGGRVPSVINALIAADRAKIDLPWNTACAIDLAGRDILDAVQTSVNPKVIDCPNPAGSGRSTIDAVAKDGIQLRAKARVTVRTNIPRLIGGATEETIIARVGEGIISTIGSATSHKEVLENPDRISKTVLQKGLDAGTAFEILSIDIADIDVGDNIGAKLQGDQAEADKKRFQAEAEKRRAMAVAEEQEMKAKIHENRAKVVEMEALVPQALADALRSGNLGALDYYQLRNVLADTDMRSSIGKSVDPNAPSGGQE